MVHIDASCKRRHTIKNGIIMMVNIEIIDTKKKYKLPKEYNKKWVVELQAQIIRDTDIDDLIEEIQRRYKFDE